jgi:hypothetical protein
MDTITVTTSGFADLEQALEQFKPATGVNILRRAARKALEPMRAHAASLAPDDPKTPPLDLHTAIEISEKQKSGRQLGFTISPNSVTMYMGPTREGYPEALPQEFGWMEGGRFHPGQPYMAPAWDAGAERLLEDVATDLANEIDRTAARAAAKAQRLADKVSV